MTEGRKRRGHKVGDMAYGLGEGSLWVGGGRVPALWPVGSGSEPVCSEAC